MANYYLTRDTIKEYIVTCMWGIIQEKTQNIKSGWAIILSIFKLAAQDSQQLVRIAIQALEKIIKNDFYIDLEENFVEVIACLMKFLQNKYDEEALMGLKLVEVCASKLTEEGGIIQRKMELQKRHPSTDGCTDDDVREAVMTELWLPIL